MIERSGMRVGLVVSNRKPGGLRRPGKFDTRRTGIVNGRREIPRVLDIPSENPRNRIGEDQVRPRDGSEEKKKQAESIELPPGHDYSRGKDAPEKRPESLHVCVRFRHPSRTDFTTKSPRRTPDIEPGQESFSRAEKEKVFGEFSTEDFSTTTPGFRETIPRQVPGPLPPRDAEDHRHPAPRTFRQAFLSDS